MPEAGSVCFLIRLGWLPSASAAASASLIRVLVVVRAARTGTRWRYAQRIDYSLVTEQQFYEIVFEQRRPLVLQYVASVQEWRRLLLV